MSTEDHNKGQSDYADGKTYDAPEDHPYTAWWEGRSDELMDRRGDYESGWDHAKKQDR